MQSSMVLDLLIPLPDLYLYVFLIHHSRRIAEDVSEIYPGR